MHEHEHDIEVEREERGIYAIITMASLPVVLGLLLEGGSMDGGTTLSLVLVVLGVTGLIAGLVAGARALSRPKIPRATVHRS